MPKTILVFAFMINLSLVHAQNLNVDSLLTVLKTAKEDTNKVILYRILAGTLRLREPSRAIDYGKAGTVLGKQLNFDKGVAGCYLNLSACYSSLGKLDSALSYIDTAIFYSHKAGDPNRLALAYLNRADFYMQLQDFDQSLKNCDTSFKYAELANSDDRRARVLQTIGSVYFFQKLYTQGIDYYNKANALYRKINNLQMSAVVLNNLATIYKNTGDYKNAAENLQQAINIADSLKDFSNLSLYYGTLSDVCFHSGNYSLAEKYATICMQYAQQMKNEISVGNAWEYLGQVYLKQKKNTEALTALNNGFAIFKKLGDYDKINTTAGILADAYAAYGNYAKAYEFLNISRQANDTLVKHRYDEDIAAMQTRFKVDEKDKEILLLNKDKELREARLKQQQFYLITSIAIAILALLGIWLLVNRNKLHQRMKELQLRNRIATDLHDEVGSSLSSIHVMSNMATRQQERDQKLNDTLVKISSNAQDTMERMGDIVWAIHPANDTLEQLIVRMKEFAADILEPLGINYSFVIQEDLTSAKLTVSQRRDLYLLFKEAINNAAKYSNCKHVQIELMQKDGKLILRISDDGKGFEENTIVHGNGLNNMQQRAKSIGGSLSVNSIPSQGTTVSLSIKA